MSNEGQGQLINNNNHETDIGEAFLPPLTEVGRGLGRGEKDDGECPQAVEQPIQEQCGADCKSACGALSIPENSAFLFSNLKYLYYNSMLTDSVIRTSDGGYFPVHRIILCGASDYFRALYSTTLHRKRKSDVVIAGIDADKMKTLLKYIYSHQVTINERTVTDVLEASDYLGVVELKRECYKFIESQLDNGNCIGIRNFAKAAFCPELELAAHKYLMKNFIDVSRESEELLELSLPEVIEIFGHDELNVKNEEVVWEAVLRWIDHNHAPRKGHIVDLLTQVRCGLMETGYFMEKVKDNALVHGNDGCRPIVIETLRFLYDLEVITEKNGEIPTPNIARPRIPHEVLFAIGGWSGGSPTNFIETYDTRADRWIQIDEVDEHARAYHGTVTLGQDIYVIGGFDGQEYFNTVRAFNTTTKKWRSVAPMHSKRCYVSVAVLTTADGKKIIYALGGFDGHNRLNTGEKYDPAANQWTVIPPMVCQRSDASAAELDGKIYITGGFDGQECLSSCEVFDPVTSQWSLINPPMKNRRSGVSCVAYHGCIYVIGGFNGVSRMASGEKYNPVTRTWDPIPDMYNPRSNFAIEVIDDMVFVIGGFNGVTTIYHVECYDEKTNEWYEATDMNIFRSALSACVMSDLPNMNDYIHQHRERLMEEKRLRLLTLQQQRTSS